MSEHPEQFVGTLFRILEDEGYTAARKSLLDAYHTDASTDREELAENLVSELVSVLDRQLDTRDQVDVLAATVERLRSRFASVIEAAPVAILVVDANGGIQLWNDGAERMFGWSEAEMRRRSYPDALTESPEVTGEFLDRLRDGERLDGVETRHHHRNGSVLDVRVWAAPYRTDGSFDGATFVISDITDQKNREQRLAVLNRVLRHNIRNDITVVQGRIDIIAEDYPEIAEHVDVIEDRLSNVVELSDAARHIEEIRDQGNARLDTVDLGEVLRERIDRLESAYPGTEIGVSVPDSVPVVAHELFPYALDNVLENALEHNDAETPRVEVDVGREWPANRIVVCVADNGPGLPAMERQVLVAETETPLDHSSGMGLWLTRWITRSSEGAITVAESRLGGTCVQFRLRPPDAARNPPPDADESAH